MAATGFDTFHCYLLLCNNKNKTVIIIISFDMKECFLFVHHKSEIMIESFVF